MSKVSVYSTSKKTVGNVSFPKDYIVEPNMALVAQAVRVLDNRQHQGTSKTKRRGEINLTKQKWFRQKGTGRARHGAKSAPIFVGGGKAHGPDGKKRVLKLNKKMASLALKSTITLKLKNDKVAMVEGISNLKKTKEAANLLSKIEAKRILMLLGKSNLDKYRVFRNIKNVKVMPFSDLNAYEVHRGGTLVFDADIFEKKVTKKTVKTKKESK